MGVDNRPGKFYNSNAPTAPKQSNPLKRVDEEEESDGGGGAPSFMSNGGGGAPSFMSNVKSEQQKMMDAAFEARINAQKTAPVERRPVSWAQYAEQKANEGLYSTGAPKNPQQALQQKQINESVDTSKVLANPLTGYTPNPREQLPRQIPAFSGASKPRGDITSSPPASTTVPPVSASPAPFNPAGYKNNAISETNNQPASYNPAPVFGGSMSEDQKKMRSTLGGYAPGSVGIRLNPNIPSNEVLNWYNKLQRQWAPGTAANFPQLPSSPMGANGYPLSPAGATAVDARWNATSPLKPAAPEFGGANSFVGGDGSTNMPNNPVVNGGYNDAGASNPLASSPAVNGTPNNGGTVYPPSQPSVNGANPMTGELSQKAKDDLASKAFTLVQNPDGTTTYQGLTLDEVVNTGAGAYKTGYNYERNGAIGTGGELSFNPNTGQYDLPQIAGYYVWNGKYYPIDLGGAPAYRRNSWSGGGRGGGGGGGYSGADLDWFQPGVMWSY